MVYNKGKEWELCDFFRAFTVLKEINVKNYGFFALAFRQKYIKRWGLMYNISEETLSEHACEVAIVAHALALIGNRYFKGSYNSDRIAALGLFHDVPEVYTGDLPTPIKYFNANSKESYREIEKKAIEILLAKLPPELSEDYREIFYYEDNDPGAKKLIKAADKICAYIKCLDEERCGNNEFTSAKKTLLKALEELSCPEAEYFMDHFLSYFNMTLDELQYEGEDE